MREREKEDNYERGGEGGKERGKGVKRKEKGIKSELVRLMQVNSHSYIKTHVMCVCVCVCTYVCIFVSVCVSEFK